MDAQHLAALHDFYVVVGTSGAAFAGFVYVAVSINVRTIGRHEDDRALFYYVHMTVFSFLALLIVALGFLRRPADPHAAALALFLAGGLVALAAGMALSAWESSALLQTRSPRSTVIVPLGISCVCLLVAAVSWAVPAWLAVVPALLFLLMAIALASVWGLMSGLGAIGIAEDEEAEKHGRGTSEARPIAPPASFYGRWFRPDGGGRPHGLGIRAGRMGSGPQGRSGGVQQGSPESGRQGRGPHDKPDRAT
jgi:hypothetical protein